MLELQDYCDLHLHSAPAPFVRIGDGAEIAQWCAEAGMRAIVIKSHFESTVSKVHHARRAVAENWPGFEVHSSITLNRGVGGLNPGAVELALEQGTKCVWLPTLDAANHARAYGGAGTYGFADMTLTSRRPTVHPAYEVVDGAGRLRAEVDDIIAMTMDYDVILGTGHLSAQEIRQVVDRCAALGHRKLVITHPELRTASLSLDEMRDFTAAGAHLEFCAVNLFPMFHCLTLDQLAGYCTDLPLDRLLLSSDGGQPFNPRPHEALRVVALSLRSRGVPESTLDAMCKTNPMRLLTGGQE